MGVKASFRWGQEPEEEPCRVGGLWSPGDGLTGPPSAPLAAEENEGQRGGNVSFLGTCGQLTVELGPERRPPP